MFTLFERNKGRKTLHNFFFFNLYNTRNLQKQMCLFGLRLKRMNFTEFFKCFLFSAFVYTLNNLNVVLFVKIN